MIKLNSVSRLYPARAEAGEVIRALDSVSLHVESGEWLARGWRGHPRARQCLSARGIRRMAGNHGAFRIG